MFQKIKLPLIGLVAIALAIYLSADARTTRPEAAGEGGTSAAEPALKRVKTATVEASRTHRELRFSGTTRAVRRARLAFSLGGRVVARPVEIGVSVARGQVLARLDDLEVENAVASARAAVAELAARRAQSERDRDRAEQLVAAKAATGEELEQTVAAVDAIRAAEQAAAARLRETERLRDETELRSPFAGTVTAVHYEPGEYAVAGQPVVTLAGDGEIEIEVEVPESVIGRISAGDEVAVRLPARGETVTGRVASVARSAAGPGRLFPVVAALPATAGLAAGMTAELILKLELDDALAVPVEAVVNPGGRRPSVYRIVGSDSGDIVEKVAVEVLALRGERVSVRAELAAGDRIVVGGQRGLLAGERVEVER